MEKASETATHGSAHYRSAFVANHLGIAVYDPGVRLLEANQAFCDLLGYDHEELAGLTSGVLTHPDDLELSQQRVRELAAGRLRTMTLEKRYLRKDGTVLHARVGATAVLDGETGAVSCIVVTIEDIGPRKDAEAALEAERRRTNEILESITRRVSGLHDEEFLARLTRGIAEQLDADYAFVGRLHGDPPDRVQTIAVAKRDGLIDNVEYLLDGTPCADVVADHVCVVPAGAQERYPRDAMLVDMNVHAYFGITLSDAAGQPIGLLSVMRSTPLREVERHEAVLRVFGVQAAAELERLRAEEARAASEETRRLLFDNMRMAILEFDVAGLFAGLRALQETGVTDFRGHVRRQPAVLQRLMDGFRILAANPEAVRLYEADNHAALLERYGQVYVPASMPKMVDLLARLFDGERLVDCENVYRGLRGGTVHVVSNCVFTDVDGPDARCVVAALDITERKRAEESTRRSRELLANAERIGAMGSFRWDVASDKLEWSDGLHRIFGTDPATFRGDSSEFFERVHADDRDRVRKIVLEAPAGRSPPEYTERVVRADGEVRTLRTQIEVERDAAGTLVAVSGICRDVTDVVRAEQERQELEQRMLHMQKLESLGVLAGGIAHDFNNLLATILGNAELLATELDGDAGRRERVDEIIRGSVRAAELCDRMLTYAGRGTYVLGPVDLDDAVREIGKLLTASLPKKVELAYELGPELPPVQADASQVRQVVLNLITNAAESYDDTAGTVTIRTAAVEVRRGARSPATIPEAPRPGRYVQLTVEDGGRGISTAVLGRIFDPFYTTRFAGRGLGLATVLGIVRRHEGAIGVESAPGRGTLVRVLLPVSEHPVTVAPDDRDPAPDWRGAGRALVIDDESAVRAALEAALTHLGFDVEAEGDPRAGVGRVRECAPDLALLVLDLTMPHLSGFEIFARARSARADLPVLICSGYNEADADELRGDPHAAFLKKPWKLTTLRDAVRSLLT